jgi:N-acetylmuramoyl-L-alanine amidase CwlA
MDRSELGQLLNLSEELIPVGKQNRPGTRIRPSFVTMHNTSNANAGADARAHSRFVRNTGYYMHNGKKNWVSWHYSVDDRCVLKHLPANEKGYHAGSGNSVSIGIEVCMHQGIDRAEADLRAARLAAALLFDFGLGIGALRTHKSWTGKLCPTLLLSHWASFVRKVEEIRASITSSGFVQPPEELGLEEAIEAGDVHDDQDIDHDELAAALVAPSDEE